MKKLLVSVVVAVVLVAGVAFYRRARAPGVAGGGTLQLYAMSDYFPEELLKAFEARCGCSVRYDNYANNEELLAKLQAGATGYDVIVPSDYMVSLMRSAGLLQPLDSTKIPSFKNLDPQFTDLAYDPGSKYSAAFTWGTTGLAYNTEFVKEPVDSWGVLKDPRYKARIALLDDGREVFGIFLKTLGYSLNSTDPAQLREAQKAFRQVKPSVRIFSSDPKQQLLSGDVWIAHIYSGDAEQVIQSNPKIQYVVPKEGGVLWIDALAIPKGAAHPELAHQFIDFILSPESGQKITETHRYGSPNRALEGIASIDAYLKPSYLARMRARGVEELVDLGDALAVWDQLWSEAKGL